MISYDQLVVTWFITSLFAVWRCSKTVNVRTTVTQRRDRVTSVSVEKQEISHILSVCFYS